MLLKTATCLAFATACLTTFATLPAAQAQMARGDELVTNGPQSSGIGDSGAWSPRQNVIQSEHYDRMVQSSRAFRDARIRKECSPITDAQLHASCVASFNQDEPAQVGSSTPPRTYRSNYGR